MFRPLFLTSCILLILCPQVLGQLLSRSPSRSISRLPSRSTIRSPSRSILNSPSRSIFRSPSRSPVPSPSTSPRASPSPSPVFDCQRVAGFTAMAQVDRDLADIGQWSTASPTTLASMCTADSTCVAFSTTGWLKTAWTPLQAFPGFCFYVKGCAQIPGYTAFYNMGNSHNSINVGHVDVLGLAQQCSQSADCAGFNSDGWLKTSAADLTSTSDTCLWVQGMYFETPANDYGNGNSVYLDRHFVACPDGYGLTTFGLYQPAATTMQYQMGCSEAPLGSCITTTTNFDSDGSGDTIYLDRHTVSCPSVLTVDNQLVSYVLTKFRLIRDDSQTQIQYSFTCCASPSLGTPEVRYTDCTTRGGGRVENLAAQHLHCNYQEMMTSFHLKACDSNTWQYEYYCASLSTIQPPTVVASSPGASSCWKPTTVRGAGTGLHACPGDYPELDGLLCYPLCSSGYYGVGPVCWQSCPSGFRDDGAYCYKPSEYGRGAGYISWDQCEQENSQGCETYGLLYYPKCADGFYAAGCCICSPFCPSGSTDIGISCQKNSYGRGAGVAMTCSSDEDQSGALCYPKCPDGYIGNGPVCWKSCPSGLHDCGAFCDENCPSSIALMALDAIQLAIQIAAVISGGDDTLDLADTVQSTLRDYITVLCD